ncbi:MAG: DNA-binding transcriptional LysR family regulator [Myxococcota bacterium]|jgi:DNA-binding transcriptional LysR family regulator
MDRLGELEAFAAVAQNGSFTAAARSLGRTTSSVSKQIQSLEARLSVRLLHRTTRRVSLTEIGIAFRDRVQGVLSDLDEAEMAVAELHEEPRGLLRVSIPTDFGRLHLAETLARFATQYADIRLEVDFSDRFVDVVEEGFDIVIRIANLADSSLVARRMGPCRRVLCAAPAYLEANGHPADPSELSRHSVIGYAYEQTRQWRFRTAGAEQTTVSISPRHRANSGEMIRSMLLSGLGIALLPTFLIGDDLRAGRLEALFADRLEADTVIWAVTLHRKLLTAKVRLLLDHFVSGCGEHPPWDEGLGANAPGVSEKLT